MKRISEYILIAYIATLSVITLLTLIVNKDYLIGNYHVYLRNNTIHFYENANSTAISVNDEIVHKITNRTFDQGKVVLFENNKLSILDNDNQEHIIFIQDVVGKHLFYIAALGILVNIGTKNWFIVLFVLFPCLLITLNSFQEFKSDSSKIFASIYPIWKYKFIRFVRKYNLKW
ncbi:MAG: hypothetical protein KDC60_07255 [Bacteroidetes bacterium]|nr:hypothetical protein [Bacteroidota bacterium]